MRVVAAPDSFKGSLSAMEAAEAIACGVKRACPACIVETIPIADGGEGTLDVLVHARGGEYRTYLVQDPLGQPVAAQIGLIEGGRIGIVEMAQASGLLLLPPAQRNPLRTSSYGTGELIRACLDLGCDELIITLGGSATVDGGLGMLAALGAKFFDAQQELLPPLGASLPRLAAVDLTDLDQRLRACRITIASDVTNPVCGPAGAAPVFGPQKGATPAMVETLALGLQKLAQLTAAVTGVHVEDLPGGGAAGGLGAALVAYAGGVIRSGIDVVLDALHIDKQLAGAQLVFTGEGRLDGQTAQGKAPVGLAQRARAHGCQVIALVGSLGEGYEAVFEQGIDGIWPILAEPQDLASAMASADSLLAAAAYRAMRFYCRILGKEKN
ncbi:MAG: glycerate kinase [Firmicutes bacterium]|nr:glycerate kinase [Bacillota bacterium]